MAYIDRGHHLVIARGGLDETIAIGGTIDSFSWSPSGQSIAVTSTAPDGSSSLIIYNVSERKIDRQAALDEPSFVTWAPAGNNLLLDSGTSASGRALSIVNADTFAKILSTPYAYGAHFSPSGKQLVLGEASAVEPPLPLEDGQTCSVAIVDIDSGDHRTMLQGDAKSLYSPMMWLREDQILIDVVTVTGSDCSSAWRCLSPQTGNVTDVPNDLLDAPWGTTQIAAKLPEAVAKDLANYRITPDQKYVGCIVNRPSGPVIEIVDMATKTVVRNIEGDSIQWSPSLSGGR